MAGTAVPDDVAQLLATAIESVADLEVLLFLRRRPEAEWDANAVADLLFLDRPQSAAILNKLRERQLLTARSEPHLLYRYAPSAEAAATIDRLADLYAERRLMVIAQIAVRRPADSLRLFSDAFRFRKDG